MLSTSVKLPICNECHTSVFAIEWLPLGSAVASTGYVPVTKLLVSVPLTAVVAAASTKLRYHILKPEAQLRYDTMDYINVPQKLTSSQLNLLHVSE